MYYSTGPAPQTLLGNAFDGRHERSPMATSGTWHCSYLSQLSEQKRRQETLAKAPSQPHINGGSCFAADSNSSPSTSLDTLLNTLQRITCHAIWACSPDDSQCPSLSTAQPLHNTQLRSLARPCMSCGRSLMPHEAGLRDAMQMQQTSAEPMILGPVPG